MSRPPVAAVILAAGKGTRFKSDLAKVLHNLLGRPMIDYAVGLVGKLNLDRTVVVVGHQAEAVEAALAGLAVSFSLQAEQKGTAHAVLSAEEELADFSGQVLILSGDVPLLRAETIRDLIYRHLSVQATLSFVVAELPDPSGYGRVIKVDHGFRVVEHKDATDEERNITLVNAGIYLVEKEFLFQALKTVRPDNAQAEYYLPDLIHLASIQGLGVKAVMAADPVEIMGVNDRAELARAEKRLRQEVILAWLKAGVTCQDPEAVYPEGEVVVGPDTFIGAGVHLVGPVWIGRGAIIEPNCFLKDCRLGDGAVVRFGQRLEGVTLAPGQTKG